MTTEKPNGLPNSLSLSTSSTHTRKLTANEQSSSDSRHVPQKSTQAPKNHGSERGDQGDRAAFTRAAKVALRSQHTRRPRPNH